MAKQARQPEKIKYEDAPASVAAPVKILIAVACFGLALLLLYLTFATPQEGTAMLAIRTIMRGIGGAICPVLSLILVWIGVLLVFSARGSRVRKLNVVLNSFLFLCVFSAVEVFFVDAVRQWGVQSGLFSYDLGFADFLSKSYQYGGGGGALGALLAYPAEHYLGKWGGFLALLLLMVLCLTATGRAQKIVHGVRTKTEAYAQRSEEKRAVHEAEHMFDKYDELDADVRKAPARQPEKRRLTQQEQMRRQEARRRVEKRAQERPMHRVSDPNRKSMYIESNPQKQKKADKFYDFEDDAEVTAPRKKASAWREPMETAPRAEKKASAWRETAATTEKKASAWKESVETEPVEKKPKSARVWKDEPVSAPEEEKSFEVEQEIPKALRRDKAEKPAPAPRKKPDVKPMDPFELQPDDEDEEDVEFAPQNYAATKPKKQTVVEGVRALSLDDDEPPFDVPGKKQPAKPVAKIPKAENPEPEEEEYNYPPIDLLAQGEAQKITMAHKDADQRKADKLIEALESFGIETRLIGIAHGPAVTRFELQPAPGVKVARITALSDDIALNLAAESVRIEAPIPGKAAVGVEIPNDKIEMVRLRDVLESSEAKHNASKIAVGLGKDNSGRYVVADIAKMPHVLIAGQTGSGKSVCINSIIASILYRATPDEVRMILIDPKVVELSIYNDIPHLIAPVVTDPKKASSALQWAVMEMTNRYKRFAERGVRDIKGYNKALEPGEKIMPQFVIVIDELADLMMVAPGEVEDSICRLAQLARAAGMHLVIATQRPSVNVITGIIKANIPTRIAFSVASQVDSRTMIDHGGAEKLLGNGDMLFVPNGTNKPIRAQGSWISDEEVHAVVTYIKARTETTYDEDVVEKIENSVRSDAEKEEVESEYDSRLQEAVEIVVEAGQASTSMLQRRMRVGYARAGRMIDEMEKRGIVSAADGAKPRDVLISREQMNELFED